MPPIDERVPGSVLNIRGTGHPCRHAMPMWRTEIFPLRRGHSWGVWTANWDGCSLRWHRDSVGPKITSWSISVCSRTPSPAGRLPGTRRQTWERALQCALRRTHPRAVRLPQRYRKSTRGAERSIISGQARWTATKSNCRRSTLHLPQLGRSLKARSTRQPGFPGDRQRVESLSLRQRNSTEDTENRIRGMACEGEGGRGTVPARNCRWDGVWRECDGNPTKPSPYPHHHIQ